MDFLDVGWQEILLILAVVLIIFGPGRLVEISRTLGKTFRTIKNMSSNLTAQVTKEIQNSEQSTGQGDNKDSKPESAK